MSQTVSIKPFPALTPAQRLYLDINGYVVIENVLSKAEVDKLLDTIYKIERVYRETGALPAACSHFSSTKEDFFRIDNLPHIDLCFFEYVTHPRLVGMAEEIVGGTVRLEQSDAHIRRPVKHQTEPESYGFHRGINPGFSYIKNGLYHFTFVKTLTNLTDLEPGDGGTTVIAGTHKISEDVDRNAIVKAALDDPRIIHEVAAPAGSTLLFFESLMHSSGIIRSNKDRVLIIAGYTPTMFQAWNGYDPDPVFVEDIAEDHRALLTGSQKYGWERKLRRLETPASPSE
ncbi:MAG: phytanoyl-CoA dioxygenase family protein [Candidatus Latescibacteria bacterium]|nr:phytanoyl-CoA dioxygenase family protein [Candidatus Latescibacterota bacterium]